MVNVTVDFKKNIKKKIKYAGKIQKKIIRKIKYIILKKLLHILKS